eukprot:COSAG01_NODE_68423_length_264_cov_0.624242_1_plen_20_part_10
MLIMVAHELHRLDYSPTENA